MKYLGFAIWVILTILSCIFLVVSLVTLVSTPHPPGPGAPLEGVATGFNIGILLISGFALAGCIWYRINNR